MIGVESKDMHMPSPTMNSIRVPNNSYNDATHSLFDYSHYTLVESIEIGDDCFAFVQTFKIEGLNRLRSLRIGKNSFTQVKENEWNNDYQAAESRVIIGLKSFQILNCKENEWNNDYQAAESRVIIGLKSFQILNCKLLESIEIGEYSFSDYGGDFELKNLNSLQSITVGKIGIKSWNFDIHSSFILRGM